MKRFTCIIIVAILAIATSLAAETSIPIYSSKSLSVVAKDSQGNSTDIGARYRFSSSDPAKCTVDPAVGTSTRVSSGPYVGDCTIEVQRDSDGATVGSELVHITPGAPASYTLIWQ